MGLSGVVMIKLDTRLSKSAKSKKGQNDELDLHSQKQTQQRKVWNDNQGQDGCEWREVEEEKGGLIYLMP